MMNIFFTEKLARNIALDYQNLIGQTFITLLGELTIETVEVVEVAKDEYDVIVKANTDDVQFTELHGVRNITEMRLIDFLKEKEFEFIPRRYGALLGKFTTEKDDNGIDLYI